MSNTVLLNSVSLTASAANRTATLSVTGGTELLLEILLARSAATELEIVPEFSTDGGSSYMSLTSRDIEDGVGTLSEYSDKITVSGDISFNIMYDIHESVNAVRFIVNHTNGAAADKITVRVGTP